MPHYKKKIKQDKMHQKMVHFLFHSLKYTILHTFYILYNVRIYDILALLFILLNKNIKKEENKMKTTNKLFAALSLSLFGISSLFVAGSNITNVNAANKNVLLANSNIIENAKSNEVMGIDNFQKYHQ